MITREEAIHKGLKLGTSELGIDLSGVVPKLVHEIYNSIEQQIKELEALQAHKTCDECKWKSNPNLHHAYCGNCSRAIHLKDNYKPKG